MNSNYHFLEKSFNFWDNRQNNANFKDSKCFNSKNGCFDISIIFSKIVKSHRYFSSIIFGRNGKGCGIYKIDRWHVEF